MKALSDLSGVSPRTIRYYDQIDLLKPAFINDVGYRFYTIKEVDLLQQILFYRQLKMPLEQIRALMQDVNYQPATALASHLALLQKQKQELDDLIDTIQKTIDYQKGAYIMSDKEKFIGIKQQMIADNEAQFGEEVRKRYGDAAVNKANEKVLSMSETDAKTIEELGNAVITKLKALLDTKDIQSELGQEVAVLHKKWLTYYWDEYSAEAHKNLAQMYLADQRFQQFYDDAAGAGATELLVAAIEYHL